MVGKLLSTYNLPEGCLPIIITDFSQYPELDLPKNFPENVKDGVLNITGGVLVAQDCSDGSAYSLAQYLFTTKPGKAVLKYKSIILKAQLQAMACTHYL